MLIHGARAVLFRVKYDTGGFGQWVHRLAQRAPSNKVVVAIANKLARIASPCCRVEKIIDISRCSSNRQCLMAVEKSSSARRTFST